FRNTRGQEFAVVTGPVQFLMGAPADDVEQDDRGTEQQHLRQIPRSFAIAMREVTVEEFLQFEPSQYHDPGTSPDATSPMTDLSWVDAAKYCRWLSEQEDIPEEEMCFPPLDQITADVQLPPDVLERTGYRLPTAAEWEYSCRAGTTTSRWIGGREQLPICAWFRENSEDHAHPTGVLSPNGLGLFDTLGNVVEYCQNYYFDDLPETVDGQPIVDGADSRDGYSREARGGSFGYPPASLRASTREVIEYADIPLSEAGFRLARTIRDAPRAATAAE
ncbi:MAG: formylglycine-generating enzyme family protein, partial [Planctomycetaceae bacterium]|nr:formylglycine-generating enzyme family protein [Planctomycetaceae bacterium]